MTTSSHVRHEAPADREPRRATEAEMPALRALVQALGPESEQPALVKLRYSTGRELELPASAFELLRQAVHALARGKAVAVVPIDTVLTTQQVADLLNVSRPHAIKLLESGEIPFQKTGTHRRVRLQDALDYRQRRDASRRALLDEMARDAQDVGLVD